MKHHVGVHLIRDLADQEQVVSSEARRPAPVAVAVSVQRVEVRGHELRAVAPFVLPDGSFHGSHADFVCWPFLPLVPPGWLFTCLLSLAECAKQACEQPGGPIDVNPAIRATRNGASEPQWRAIRCRESAARRADGSDP